MDLDQHINNNYSYLNVDIAISRFRYLCQHYKVYSNVTQGEFNRITEQYIDDIVQLVWRGHSAFDGIRINNFFSNIWFRAVYLLQKRFIKIGLDLPKLVDRKMYLAIGTDEFYNRTERYIADLFDAMGRKKSIIAVDQMFPANEPWASMKYVSGSLAIVIDRDPRDIFLSMKEKKHMRFMPVDNVEEYVEYYKLLRTKRDKVLEDSRILFFYYEDIVLNYEDCIRKIEEFLHINNHIHKKEYFDPNNYLNRIGIWNKKKYDEVTLQQIRYIEKELKKYLYI